MTLIKKTIYEYGDTIEFYEAQDVQKAIKEMKQKFNDIWYLRESGDNQSPDTYIEYLENDFDRIFK